MGIKKEVSYWENHLDVSQFAEWCGNKKSQFKVETRQVIRARGYKSVLDVGAGIFSEYYGFLGDGYDIKYSATEITPKYVKIGKDNGIDVHETPIERLPFGDNSYECVICHDVLNHVKDTKSAVEELIRVASKEIFISLFKPFQKEYLENLSRYNGGFPYETTSTATIEDRIIIKDQVVCQYVYINKDYLENILETSEKVSSFTYHKAQDDKLILIISVDNNITYE
jgi:ubiquinone/menaquinone biosynthesis C-methylase UbiE